MGTMIGLGINWRQAVLEPGEAIQVAANFGSMGTKRPNHWWRERPVPSAYDPDIPQFNVLAAGPYHQNVKIVSVSVRVPAQQTPQMRFRPAGNATASPGAQALPLRSQVWTGA